MMNDQYEQPPKPLWLSVLLLNKKIVFVKLFIPNMSRYKSLWMPLCACVCACTGVSAWLLHNRISVNQTELRSGPWTSFMSLGQRQTHTHTRTHTHTHTHTRTQTELFIATRKQSDDDRQCVSYNYVVCVCVAGSHAGIISFFNISVE